MYQSYTIVGRLAADAQQRFTNGQNATSVVNFRVITSKKVKDKEISFSIDVSLWGRLGEAIHQYLAKGQLVLASGELETQSWEKDGQKHYKTVLRAEVVRLLGGKRDNGNNQPAPAPAPAGQSNDPFDIDF
jgi:single-strand DNA-binding protein